MTWTSSDDSVVSISDGNGSVEGDGTAVLTASLEGIAKSITLTVDIIPPKLQSATRDSGTRITVTLSEPCLNLTNTNDGGFTVTRTGTGDTFAVTAMAQGADANQIILIVENTAPAWKNGLTVAYTAGGNGKITDIAGNPLATDSTGVIIPHWVGNGGSSDENSSESSSDTPGQPEKTITVTEISSEVFKNAKGPVMIEADMGKAFSYPVEVKVTDTQEDAASFGLDAGDMVYTFDISFYIKSTNEKTKPLPGYAVTVSLPVPENLLDVKERLVIMHKSESGIVTEISSYLEQKNGVWYIVFESTEFSPYALVVRKTGRYDESAGIPYYLDADGNRVFIGFAANGKYLAPDGVTVSVMKNGKNFTDIDGHWAEEYIGFVTEREVFAGTGESIFSPDMSMTRAMFAMVIGRLYERSYGEIETSGLQIFIDCNYDAYYGKYIVWASENGIINGYGNGNFGPDDKITREQMAVIIYCFADFLGVIPESMDTVLRYPDADRISDYAKNAALYCQTTGIIAGRAGGVFAPNETSTRAEVAAIIQRFVEAVLD